MPLRTSRCLIADFERFYSAYCYIVVDNLGYGLEISNHLITYLSILLQLLNVYINYYKFLQL